jgi:hypothetical protein
MLLALASLAGAATAAPVDFALDPEAVFMGLDFQSVWQQRGAILATNPDDPLAFALVGRSWLEGGEPADPDQAALLCQQGLDIGGAEWKLAECHLGLAIAHWMQGNREATIAECDRAAQVSPRSRARQEADLLRLCMDMTAVSTEHLVVFAPPNSAVAANLQAWANRREQAVQRILSTFGMNPWRRVRVVVCDSQQQAEAFLGHGVGYTDRPDCVVYTRADQTPGHELTHALSLFLMPGHPWGGGPDTREGRGRLLNEGMAVALDDSGRDLHGDARRTLPQAVTAGQSTYESLNRSGIPESILYPLAGSFVGWLVEERGADAFVALWRHPGTEIQAAREVYGTTLDSLWSEWMNALPNL